MKVNTVLVCSFVLSASLLMAQRGPGPRGGPPQPGQALRGLTSSELAAFMSGLATFNEVDDVADGLGPRFN